MRPSLFAYVAGAVVLTAGAVLVRLLRSPVPEIGRSEPRKSLTETLIPRPSEWESLPQRLREQGLQ